jgi:hypothetical protein
VQKAFQQNCEIPRNRLQDLQTIINKQTRAATRIFKSTSMGFLMAKGAMKPAEAIYIRRSECFQARQLPGLISEPY